MKLITLVLFLLCQFLDTSAQNFEYHLVDTLWSLNLKSWPIQKDVIEFKEKDLGILPRFIAPEWKEIDRVIKANKDSISVEQLLEIDKKYSDRGIDICGIIPQVVMNTYTRSNLLDRHLKKVVNDVMEKIEYDYTGYVVIDYEAWDPGWYKCGDKKDGKKYRQLSKALAKYYSGNAMQDYENAGREYLIRTIEVCKAVRPNAKWGYYGYPARFSVWRYNNRVNYDSIKTMNNNLNPLWKTCAALFPGMYSYNRKFSYERTENEKNLDEWLRIAKSYCHGRLYPFIWYRYHDSSTDPLQFLADSSLTNQLRNPYNKGASGIVIWGFENTKAKLDSVQAYFEGEEAWVKYKIQKGMGDWIKSLE